MVTTLNRQSLFKKKMGIKTGQNVSEEFFNYKKRLHLSAHPVENLASQ